MVVLSALSDDSHESSTTSQENADHLGQPELSAQDVSILQSILKKLQKNQGICPVEKECVRKRELFRQGGSCLALTAPSRSSRKQASRSLLFLFFFLYGNLALIFAHDCSVEHLSSLTLTSKNISYIGKHG